MVNKTEQVPEYQVLADQERDRNDVDILLYNGPMERHLDQRVVELCRERKRRKNVLLLLITNGGDANVAYRISRCLQLNYKAFSLFVSGYCKSAGTLICAGAHELIVSPEGELGPLDVQLARKDELFETQSGLTTAAALSTLNERAFATFEDFMLQLKFKAGSGFSTRLATQVASELTVGLFSQIYQQIDPMHVGEAGRALEIAREYGRRLNDHGRNLKDGAIDRLVADYPSHNFIIDISEAKRLFNRVKPPSESQMKLAATLGATGRWPARRSEEIICFLSTELTGETKHAEQEQSGSEAEPGSEERGAGEATVPDQKGAAEVRSIKQRRRTT